MYQPISGDNGCSEGVFGVFSGVCNAGFRVFLAADSFERVCESVFVLVWAVSRYATC